MNVPFLVAALAVLPACGQQSAAEAPAAMAERVRQSIVRVHNGNGQSYGSGFVIDEKGRVATNAHVVGGMTRGQKILIWHEASGHQLPGVVIDSNRRYDIALVQLDPAVGHLKLPALPLGDSDASRVTDVVYAFGLPLGFKLSVNRGTVSGTGVRQDYGFYPGEMIQTDAGINPGNSGGPLVNARGEAIGINSMKVNPALGEAMGFAIPINRLKTLVDLFDRTGSLRPPKLGLVFYPKPGQISLTVEAIDPNGYAADADLENGDQLLEVDGKPLPYGAAEAFVALERALELKDKFQEVVLTVSRRGKKLKTSVELAARN